jgi:hypothetical protein
MSINRFTLYIFLAFTAMSVDGIYCTAVRFWLGGFQASRIPIQAAVIPKKVYHFQKGIFYAHMFTCHIVVLPYTTCSTNLIDFLHIGGITVEAS